MKFKIFLCFICFFMINSNAADFPEFRKRANQVSMSDFDETDILAEVSYGKEMAARILSIYPPYKNEKLNKYIAYLGQGISSLTGRTDIDYTFSVLDTDDVNAYSCPGGNIFITKGAIDLMENEAELVGVLAHEMGHVDYKHMVKKLKIRGSNSLFSSSMANIIGGTDNTYRIILGQLMDKGIETLFSDGYPKEDEFESDSTSIKTLVNLNYDWRSYAKYLIKIKKVIESEKASGKKLEKTHPPMVTRLNTIKNYILDNNLVKIKGRTNEERFKKITSKI